MGNVASNMQVLIENIRSIGLEDITWGYDIKEGDITEGDITKFMMQCSLNKRSQIVLKSCESSKMMQLVNQNYLHIGHPWWTYTENK